MSMILDAKRRWKLNGAVVTAFDCRGCMAENHVFLWVGRIDRFEEHYGRPQAVVTILKRCNRDIRNSDLGREHIDLHDPCLQEINRGVYGLFK